MSGIEGQNLPLGCAQLQAGGLYGLDKLLGKGALLPAGKADHLHGEGAAAAHHMAGLGVLDSGPHERHRVHPRMPPELPVLKLH